MFQYHVRDLGNIQKNDGEIIMELKDYTTEELRAELKRRNA